VKGPVARPALFHLSPVHLSPAKKNGALISARRFRASPTDVRSARAMSAALA